MRFNNEIMRDVLKLTEEKFGTVDTKIAQTTKPVMYTKIIHDERLKNYDETAAAYVVELMLKEGFFDLVREPQYDANNVLTIALIKGLSFKGHEFLKDIKDDRIWTITKEKAKTVEDCSMSVLCNVARKISEEAILTQKV